jgi:putative endopeptidase
MSVRFAAIVLLSAFAEVRAQQAAQSPPINRSYMDTTCSPCADFWRFANGGWADRARIPPARQQIGRDEEIQGRNVLVIRALLDSLAYAPQRHARTPLDRSVGAFFGACMDTTFTREGELRALEPELARLGAIRTKSDVSAAIGRLTRDGLSPLFWFVVIPDPRDPTMHAGEIRGVYGWSLSPRQLYVRGDPGAVRARAAFVEALTRVFTMLGDAPGAAEAHSQAVLDLETQIVRGQPRDSGGVPERRSLAELRRMAPSFDWSAFAPALGRPDLPPIYMRPATAASIDSLMASVPVETWRAYLRWKYVYGVAPLVDRYLGGAIGNMLNVVSGRTAGPNRGTLCVNQTTSNVGTGVARAYVQKHFSPADRTAASALIEHVRATLRDRLRTLDWLQPVTRERALSKLDAMRFWIGYPDKWGDDGDLAIAPGSATLAMLTARRHASARRIASIGRPVDRDLWVEANPAFVDLSHYAGHNALLFTAAALQPPAFDPRADLVTNLAGIGFGIGHELSHAFDDVGRLFDATGKNANWWTDNEDREFARRAQLVIDQYNQYVISDTVRVNGRSSLSENISDIAGMSLAYLAFQRATAGEASERVDGFTREQRFFIALAQGKFRVLLRPEALRSQGPSSHTIDRWRLNGSLANLSAFASAFGCKEGDPMVLPASRRGNIW